MRWQSLPILFVCLSAAPLAAQFRGSCTAMAEPGAVARPYGQAELLPPVRLACSGFGVGSPVTVFFVAAAAGADAPSFLATSQPDDNALDTTDSYVWILNGAPFQDGSNRFRLFRVRPSGKTLTVPIDLVPETSSLTFVVTGMRMDLSGVAPGDPINVRFSAGLANAGVQTVATVPEDGPIVWSQSRDAASWGVTEQGLRVLRKRQETSTTANNNEDILGRLFAETPLNPGAVHLISTFGTRVAAVFPSLDEGVQIVARNCVTSSDTPGLRLRRVDGFDTTRLSGGGLAACGGSTTITGSGTALWEVEGEEGVAGELVADSFDGLFRVEGAADYQVELWTGLGPVDDLRKAGLSAALTEDPPPLFQNLITSLPLFGAENIRAFTISPSGIEARTSTGPSITRGGVVNGASFEAGKAIAPGTITSIFGVNLAAEAAFAGSVPLPTSLGGVRVLVDGSPAPLYFISPTQINFQATAAPGAASVVVETDGQSSQSVDIDVSDVSPAIFTLPLTTGATGAVAFHAVTGVVAQFDGTVEGLATEPIARGEALTILAAGLGATNPPFAAGDASLDRLRPTASTATVTIGGVDAEVAYSGLTPQFVGVYQLNVTLPQTASPGGDVPVEVAIAGQSSQAGVTIAVQ